MNSLQRSLQLGLGASVGLLMLAFWWSGTLTVRHLAQSHVDRQLAADARSVRRAWLDVTEPLSGWPGQPALRLYPEYEHPASGRYWAIAFADGQQQSSRSAWELQRTASLAEPPLPPGAVRRSDVRGPSGEVLRVWAGGFAIDGRQATVAVAVDMSGVEERLAVARAALLAFALLLLAAVLAVQAAIVRRSLARLDAIRIDVERLGHGDVVALQEDVPEEVRPLVVEFNRLLTRFDQRLRQSRNAMGNLAHALKGPLNLLVRAADDSFASEPVRLNAERIRQLIDGELRRARLVGRTTAGRRFDLATEVDALAGLLQQVYADKHVELRLNVTAEVTVVHDRQDMLELIGNLIDNAFKWADSLVMVNARDADGLLLEVEDDGPGVGDGAIDLLTRRGVRLDESIAGDGLGLAIVRDIVTSYGGELSLGRSNRLGGFRAAVRLPERIVRASGGGAPDAR